MRKSLWIALVVVIGLYVARVPTDSATTPAPEPTATGSVAPSPAVETSSDLAEPVSGGTSGSASYQEGPRKRTSLTVLTSLGVETTLTIDDQTEVLVVATWCAYTRRTDRLLRDPRARPHLRGKRLVYLLAVDELDRMARQWVRDGRMTRAEADELIARQPDGPRLVDRDFLSSAATTRIYYYDADHPVDHGGYPSAYSGPPNVFQLNYGVWLSRRLGIPRALKDEFLDG